MNCTTYTDETGRHERMVDIMTKKEALSIPKAERALNASLFRTKAERNTLERCEMIDL